jgi:hypothetical protein
MAGPIGGREISHGWNTDNCKRASEYHSFEFNLGPPEVDEQTDFHPGCLEFVEELGLVIGEIRPRHFEFNDHSIVHQKVGFVRADFHAFGLFTIAFLSQP